MIDSESLMYSERYFSRFYLIRIGWERCTEILGLLYVRQELKDLIVWADRKGLSTTVGIAYRRKLTDTEAQLANLAIRSPRPMRWAKLLYWLNRLFGTQPRYVKGYAKRYKNSLTVKRN